MNANEYEREATRLLKKGPMRIAELKAALGFTLQSSCPELTETLKSNPKFVRRVTKDKSGNVCHEWALAEAGEVEGINSYMMPWYLAAKKKLEQVQC